MDSIKNKVYHALSHIIKNIPPDWATRTYRQLGVDTLGAIDLMSAVGITPVTKIPDTITWLRSTPQQLIDWLSTHDTLGSTSESTADEKEPEGYVQDPHIYEGTLYDRGPGTEEEALDPHVYQVYEGTIDGIEGFHVTCGGQEEVLGALDVTCYSRSMAQVVVELLTKYMHNCVDEANECAVAEEGVNG